jgi:hypothetical protein
MMIITQCSDTYVPWGKVFLESFRLTNGTDAKIHINGVHLSDKDIKQLKELYPVTIKNHSYKKTDICERFNVSFKDYERCRLAVAQGFKADCRWWMDFIVVEERISQLYQTIEDNPREKYWLHLDIDMMFRESINPLLEGFRNNDVICRFRPNKTFVKQNGKHVPDYMKIAGGMVGGKGLMSREFFKEWRDQIFTRMGDGIKGRGEPWGQTALYYAWLKWKDYMSFGQIDEKWLTAYCHYTRPIWCGHKKGNVTVHNEDGTRHKVQIPNREVFRNKVFIPELKRLKRKFLEENYINPRLIF